MEYINFGLELSKGINKYRSGMFEEANRSLSLALELKPKDFIANFYKLRTEISLNNDEKAKQYLQACIAAKPITEKELLNHFAKYLADKPSDIAISLNQLNDIADKKLKEYYHPPYSFLDIIRWIVFLFIVYYAAGIIATVIHKICAAIPYRFADTIIQLNAWIIYYYRRSIIRHNPIVVFQDTVQIIKRARYLFFGVGVGILLKTTYMSNDHMKLIQDDYFNTISAATPLILEATRMLLLEAIGLEVLYQGVLFSFIAQYNRMIAVIVTVTVYGYWEATSIYHIGMFMFYTCIYAIYKSLMLTISLHVFVYMLQASIVVALVCFAK